MSGSVVETAVYFGVILIAIGLGYYAVRDRLTAAGLSDERIEQHVAAGTRVVVWTG